MKVGEFKTIGGKQYVAVAGCGLMADCQKCDINSIDCHTGMKCGPNCEKVYLKERTQIETFGVHSKDIGSDGDLCTRHEELFEDGQVNKYYEGD